MTDNIHERSFTTAFLDPDGGVGTRGRSSSVVFETAREDPSSRVERAVFQHFGRETLLEWIAAHLAEGHTVVLHPNSRRVNPADPGDIDR
jgi:hypothetical protein